MLRPVAAARARYAAIAASNASASRSIVRFAFVCGRPGTCAAITQLLLLTSIASTSVLSWSTAAGIGAATVCDIKRSSSYWDGRPPSRRAPPSWDLLLERGLLAIMDISAFAISLAERPRPGHLGHQCSHTPGRPN